MQDDPGGTELPQEATAPLHVSRAEYEEHIRLSTEANVNKFMATQKYANRAERRRAQRNLERQMRAFQLKFFAEKIRKGELVVV